MKLLLSLIFFLSSFAFAQSLHDSRILGLTGRKRSIYVNEGIFHHKKGAELNHQLTRVRSSYVQNRGYERVVFDFDKNTVPKIYGLIDKENKKINVDLFGTSVIKNMKHLQNTKFIKSIDVFYVDDKVLSVELNLKDSRTYDIFVLESPARLVIDIK